jgi:DNA-binding beta-propeller fold protein YncE
MSTKRRFTQLFFCLMLLLAACSTPTAPQPTFTPPVPRAQVDGEVDVGGYSLYLHCEGTGSPTVVLDSGAESDSSAWATIIPRIQPLTRVCAYDRAGLGKSDPAPKKPRTSQDMMIDLHNLLANAHIEGPYLLVGWSLSGFNVRVYANRYPREVVGMVMVDCAHPDFAARYLAVLPPESPDESAELKEERKAMTIGWTDPSYNLEGMDVQASAAQVRAAGSLGDMPLVVLSSEATAPGSGELIARINRASLDMQTELAALSSNSTHIVVPNAGHCIQCDAPEVVADAILNVLDATGQATSSLGKLELVWSLTGEPTSLDAPQGVTVDTQGNVYVIDSGNARIQKFDSSGKSLMVWGETGTGPGQFHFTQFKFGVGVGPAAAAPLAVDGQSNLYVADPLNHRIQKLDASGRFLTQWGAQGDGDGQFQSPYGVAVDAKGNLFVSDFTRNDIQKFDSQGQFVLKWGGKGGEAGKFHLPGSIAVDPQGNVYVVDYGNSRIQKFDGKGKLLAAWGAQGSGSGQFNQPVAVSVDLAGSVYVLDAGNWRIQKFDAHGFFLASWVRFGKERFHAPLGMTVDEDGYIYVSDIQEHRVVKLKQP